MVKYDKDFDSMLEEMNNYWGEDGLVKFVENLLGPAVQPQEVEVQISLESNHVTDQHDVKFVDQHELSFFDGDSLAEAA